MGLIEEISLLGADIKDGLSRCLDNNALYERMLKKLPTAIEGAPVMPYIRSGDLDMAMSNAHTIKGVVGNLSLTPLYNNYSELVNLLVDGKPEKAEELLSETMKIQQDIVDCIKRYE